MSKLNKIKASVCRFYSVTDDQLLGGSRKQPIALARQIVSHLATEYYTTTKIGRELRIDHSTVVYHNKKVKEMCSIYPKFARELETIKTNING